MNGGTKNWLKSLGVWGPLLGLIALWLPGVTENDVTDFLVHYDQLVLTITLLLGLFGRIRANTTLSNPLTRLRQMIWFDHKQE